MKINFTKKEFRTLLELAHLGDWMLHAHDTRDNPETEPHRAVLQKIYSHFKEMGCEDLIEVSDGEFYETRRLEDAMQLHVERYDNESFWEELLSRLAVRDSIKQVGEDAYNAMDGYERIVLTSEKEEAWSEEFEKNGLARIAVGKVAS